MGNNLEINAHKTTVRPYAQANAGWRNTVGIDANAEIGAVLLNHSNLKAKAGARVGNTLGAGAQVTYLTPGEKVQGYFDANVDYSYSLTNQKEVSAMSTTENSKAYTKLSANNDLFTAGLGAGVVVPINNKISLSAGLEGGYCTGFNNVEKEIKPGHKLEIKHEPQMYITPKLGFEYNMKPNASIIADASLKGANVGFRYTF